jgi:hypothetical protein
MGPLFPKVVPYEKQARLRLFGGVALLESTIYSSIVYSIQRIES